MIQGLSREARERFVQSCSGCDTRAVFVIVEGWRRLLELRVGSVVGGSILRRACGRVGRQPDTIQGVELPILLDGIMESASVFLSDEEAVGLASDLMGLVPESSAGPTGGGGE